MTTSGIFVCGSPFAETALLSWSLDRHEALSAGPESRFLYQLFGKSSGLNVPYLYDIYGRCTTGHTWLEAKGISYPLFAKYLGLGIAEMFNSFSAKARWVESSPENALFIDELAYIFPHAVFIVVQESADYVVHSTLARNPKPSDDDLRKGLDQWVHYRKAVNSVIDRRADRIVLVSQDKLLTNTAETVREILDFVGENFSEDVVKFFEQKPLKCGLRIDNYREQKLPNLQKKIINLLSEYEVDSEI